VCVAAVCMACAAAAFLHPALQPNRRSDLSPRFRLSPRQHRAGARLERASLPAVLPPLSSLVGAGPSHLYKIYLSHPPPVRCFSEKKRLLNTFFLLLTAEGTAATQQLQSCCRGRSRPSRRRQNRTSLVQQSQSTGRRFFVSMGK
jgi:hypothetical protein